MKPKTAERREFIGSVVRFAGGAILAAAAWSGAWAATKKIAIPLSKAEKLKEVGGWVLLRVKDRDILFARTGDASVTASDGQCSHQKCALKYNPEKKRIDCTCHGSTFDLAGKVSGGPATQPIKVFGATLDGDRVIVEFET